MCLIIFFLCAIQTRLLLLTTACWKANVYICMFKFICLLWRQLSCLPSKAATSMHFLMEKNIESCMSEKAEQQQTNRFWGASNAAGSAWCTTWREWPQDYLDWIAWYGPSEYQDASELLVFHFLVPSIYVWGRLTLTYQLGTGPMLASQGCPCQTCPGAVKDSREKGNAWKENHMQSWFSFASFRGIWARS